MGTAAELPDFGALWDFGRPEECERVFNELLPLAAAAGAEGYRLELMTQIARAQGLQGRFDDAQRTLDQIEADRVDTAPRVRLRYLLERGRVLNSFGNPQVAAPFFREAWDLGQIQGEDALAIDAAHMLGIVEPLERQLSWSLRALDLARCSADPRARRWLGPLSTNIGWSFHDLGQFEEALAVFRQGVAWWEANGEPRQVITSRWSVARALRSLGQIEEALAMQRELLAQLDQRGERDGYVHEELAECLFALGQTAAARPHFAIAHAELAADAWLAEHEPARLERLRERGQAARR